MHVGPTSKVSVLENSIVFCRYQYSIIGSAQMAARITSNAGRPAPDRDNAPGSRDRNRWLTVRRAARLPGMLLTITLTEPPATDLGFLLHKHPDRLQSFAVSAGQAHVFYPEAAEQRCTVALLLEIDPITLVRGHRRAGSGSAEAFSLAEYVNDRPYAASSMLAVALGKVFRTAMTGRCDARPDLAARALPLEIKGGPPLGARGSEGVPCRPRLASHGVVFCWRADPRTGLARGRRLAAGPGRTPCPGWPLGGG